MSSLAEQCEGKGTRPVHLDTVQFGSQSPSFCMSMFKPQACVQMLIVGVFSLPTV